MSGDALRENIVRQVDRNNGAIARILANNVWPRFGSFIESAHTQGADTIRSDARTAELRAAVASLVAGTAVLKVKLYDLGAFTAFSTAEGQIGESYDSDEAFQSARLGIAANELEFAEQFESIDGVLAERWVVSSYVPVRPAASGRVEAVAEVYADVTDALTGIQAAERRQIGILAVAGLLVFAALLAVVWRAERRLERAHARNLELAAGVARAEAASRAKSDFIANMSHEPRTPLNAVIGFAQMIRDEILGPLVEERYRGYVADIADSGEHLLAIVNDILDLVNVENGRMDVRRGRFDPAATAAGVARMLHPVAAQAGVARLSDIADGAMTMNNDEGKIRQIMVNLLANAVKFTAAGGRVVLAVAQSPGGTVISVRDTGVGMREEDIPLALAPFGQLQGPQTTHRGGSGIGLPLSKSLAELLGGTLAIDSKTGVGTVVTVRFPPERAAAQTLEGDELFSALPISRAV